MQCGRVNEFSMSIEDLPPFIRTKYEVHEWKHACAILKTDFPNEWDDIIKVMTRFRVLRSHIIVKGGGKTKLASALDAAFKQRGWVEKSFKTQIRVDDATMDTPTHKVDCFKNCVALELEWSNKDPFYDRDLNNFRLLFDLRAVSVGVIVTKSNDMRPLLEQLGIFSKYGTTTTWMSKLIPRIVGGGGGGCPILVLGIKPGLYVEDK